MQDILLINPNSSSATTAMMVAIAAVWIARGVLHRGDHARRQDQRILAARERRGF